VLVASAWAPGVPASTGVAALALLSVPAGEVAFAVVRRARGRRSLLAGDRGHPYDRLIDRGWPVPAASGAYVGAAAVVAAGWSWPSTGAPWPRRWRSTWSPASCWWPEPWPPAPSRPTGRPAREPHLPLTAGSGRGRTTHAARGLRLQLDRPGRPDLDAFEREIATRAGTGHAVGLSSGTAGLHLALLLVGVGPGDEVLVPSFTFVATAAAVTYLGATPVLVDCSPDNWAIDPDLVAEVLTDRSRTGRLPRALVTVDLYGQTADYDALLDICDRFGVPLVEDAAEALGPPTATARPARSDGPGSSPSTATRSSPPAGGHAGVGRRPPGRAGPLPGHPGPGSLPPLRALRPGLQLPAQQPAGRPGRANCSAWTTGSPGGGRSMPPTGRRWPTWPASGSCPWPSTGSGTDG